MTQGEGVTKAAGERDSSLLVGDWDAAAVGGGGGKKDKNLN